MVLVFMSWLYDLGGLVSGHTVKHLVGAFAACWVLRSLVLRRTLAATGTAAGKGSEGVG